MSILFTSLWLEECERYIAKHNLRDAIIEKDLFSGKFNVLDAG
jgi:hypothetical protein